MPPDPVPTPDVPPSVPAEDLPGFWSRTGTKVAIGTTIGLALPFLHALIMGTPVDRAALSASCDAVVWAWGTALGIHKVDVAAIRASLRR